MKKYLPIVALLLYMGVGMRFPTSVSLAKVQAHAETMFKELSKVSVAIKPLLAQMIATESSEDVRGIYGRIERARSEMSVHLCNALEPIPSYEHAPSMGDWIAYCLARVREDTRRCEQIGGTIKPNLKDLCLRELSAS
ncbi:MAG TPA: hypothetical protein VI873_04375 [Candidatus Peribacteraceae bacterium]|nr:hypothetical protein [Candidatus Peribacteraceae bacterium]